MMKNRRRCSVKEIEGKAMNLTLKGGKAMVYITPINIKGR